MLAIAAWSLNTQSGARSIARIAVNALGGKLALGTVEGTIAGPLTVADLRYRDPEAGIDARLQRVHVDIVFRELFRPRVHVRKLQASGIDVALSRADQAAGEPKKPFSLQTADRHRDRFARPRLRTYPARRSAARRDHTRRVQRSLDVARPGSERSWTCARRRARSSSPAASGEREIYSGDGHGSFRWTGRRAFVRRRARHAHARQRRHADSEADRAARSGLAGGGHAELAVALALHARSAALRSARGSAAGLLSHEPRRLVERPRFGGARRDLGQGGDQRRAAADRAAALHAQRRKTSPSIRSCASAARPAARFISAATSIWGATPVTAKVAAKWHEVVVPAAWAGQELHTRGDLNLQGSAQSYTARGTLSLGPPERIADIALNVKGTPQRVELEQFDISQQAGRLAARGRIDLQPQLAWDVTAVAKDFDPGAFAAAWRGQARLRSSRARAGCWKQALKPRCALTQLRGELRGRPLSGNADLSLTPPLVASGTVALNSGESELRFRGRSSDQLDATVSLERRVAERLGAELRRQAAGVRSSCVASGRRFRSTATRAVATCTRPTFASNR